MLIPHTEVLTTAFPGTVLMIEMDDSVEEPITNIKVVEEKLNDGEPHHLEVTITTTDDLSLETDYMTTVYPEVSKEVRTGLQETAPHLLGEATEHDLTQYLTIDFRSNGYLCVQVGPYEGQVIYQRRDEDSKRVHCIPLVHDGAIAS